MHLLHIHSRFAKPKITACWLGNDRGINSGIVVDGVDLGGALDT